MIRRAPAEYRPFPWARLPQISKHEAYLSDRFTRLLPAAGDPHWGRAFETFWTDLTGLPTKLECLGLTTYAPGRLPEATGDAFVTTFSFPPALAPGVITIDRALVASWLDSTVGPGQTPRRLATLDDRDAGVVLFLLLQALDFLVERGAPPVTLTTHAMTRSEGFSALRRAHCTVEIDLVATSDKGTGMIRLYVPESLAAKFEDWSSQSNRTPAPSPALADVEVPGRASIGRGYFTPFELATLGPGDVVFPAELDLDDGSTAALVLSGANLGATIGHDDAQWFLELVTTNPQRTRNTMNDERNAGADEQTAQLSESVDLKAEFVVGEVRLTIAELSRLQPGRVFTLDRPIGEPLDVVVNDHVIARGELVDVDGKIGVRITSISPR